jgi:hypothetical protein
MRRNLASPHKNRLSALIRAHITAAENGGTTERNVTRRREGTKILKGSGYFFLRPSLPWSPSVQKLCSRRHRMFTTKTQRKDRENRSKLFGIGRMENCGTNNKTLQTEDRPRERRNNSPQKEFSQQSSQEKTSRAALMYPVDSVILVLKKSSDV